MAENDTSSTRSARSQQAKPEESGQPSGGAAELRKAAEQLTERADQAAQRAPGLDFDLEEVGKDADDPTSQRAPADVHAKTNEYAGALNVGKPKQLEEAQASLERDGYNVDKIETGDSPSLPVDVAQAEKERSAAERKKVAEERRDFATVTGRRPPERQRADRSKKGTGKEADKVYANVEQPTP